MKEQNDQRLLDSAIQLYCCILLYNLPEGVKGKGEKGLGTRGGSKTFCTNVRALGNIGKSVMERGER